MALGNTVLRAAIFGFFGLAVAWIVYFDPNSLQGAANTLIFWEKNPQYRLYELIGFVFSFLTLITYLAERSIGEAAHPMVRL